METMNFYNFKYCKFYLSLVEESITRSRPDQSDDKLQIEHIMPKTLNDAWRNYLGDDCEAMHQELVNTIGNLTLIRHNQELGQKLFEEKKETYEGKAGLQIAKTEIVDKSIWNGQTIQSRTRWLIKYLLDNVLAIPESMRITNNFTQKEGRGLSFQELQLIGLEIDFIDDPTIIARVVSDHEDIVPAKFKYVPMQDFSEKSDIDWSQTISNIDAQLYKKYELNDKEIEYIEKNVKEME